MTISTSMLKMAFLVAGSLGLLVGCVRDREVSPSSLSATNTLPQVTTPEFAKQSERDDAYRAAREYSDKMYEERLRGIPEPPSQFPFPNFDDTSQRPEPTHLNFYRINDHYPDYLLCQFDVDEKRYNQPLPWKLQGL
jgi:hypothetical protein